MTFTVEAFDGNKLWLIPDYYDPFEHNLFENMPERKWRRIGEQAGWAVPATKVTLDYLAEHWEEGKDYKVNEQARILMKYEQLSQLVDKVKSKKRWEYLFNETPPDFEYPAVIQPFDHQRVCVEAMYGSEHFGCLMEMGTGKTKCIIDEINLYALHRKGNEMLRILIICPKSLMINWEREFRKNFPDIYDYAIAVLNKGDMKAIEAIMELINNTAMIKIIIVSMDSVQTHLPALKAFKPNYGCVDEAHYFKNPDTKRFKAAYELFESISMRRILTGTPIANNILDVWSQFQLLKNGALGYQTYSAFKRVYAIVDDYSGWDTVVGFNEDKIEELKQNMAKMSFIVRKEQCLKSLPEKLYDIIEYEMPPAVRALYDEFKNEFCATLSSGVEINTEHIIVQMLKLSQICSGFATAYKILNKEQFEAGEEDELQFEKITEFIPGGDFKMNAMLDDAEIACKEGKLIIWSRFKLDNFIIEQRLKQRGINCGRYDSSTKESERQRIVDAFNTDESFKVFVGNPGAGGVGLTLLGTESCRTKNVFYYSNDFSYSKRLQSEDRCHRIGLRNPVMYKDYVYKDSIEQFIAGKLQDKKDLSDAVKNVGEIKEFLLK